MIDILCPVVIVMQVRTLNISYSPEHRKFLGEVTMILRIFFSQLLTARAENASYYIIQHCYVLIFQRTGMHSEDSCFLSIHALFMNKITYLIFPQRMACSEEDIP